MKTNLMIIIISLLLFIIGDYNAIGPVANIAVIIFIIGVIRMISKKNWIPYSISVILIVGGTGLGYVTRFTAIALLLVIAGIVLAVVTFVKGRRKVKEG